MSVDNSLFHDPKKLRRLVGITAFLLPISLFVLSFSVPTVCTYKTISNFYFAPFGGDILVGILFFIGFFLISYKGQGDYGSSAKTDDIVSTVAGISAFGIALFPTVGYSCGEAQEMIRAYIHTSQLCEGGSCHALDFIDYDLFPSSNDLHSLTTLVFFLALAYFSLCIFTKSAGEMTEQKKRRNRIYRITGITIIVCLLLMGIRKFFLEGAPAEQWDAAKVTFVLESIGLFAFGFAWFVKGEGVKWVND